MIIDIEKDEKGEGGMKSERKRHVHVIDGERSARAMQFEHDINTVLDDSPDAEIIFDKHQPFLAYVVCTETIEIPTTVREAYEMRGEHHTCKECPYWEQPTDRRMKYARCELGESVGKQTPACDLFYKMLNEGTLGKKKIIRR